MLPGFGWSTVGAEQNDPDTLNNLLFGHMEQTPSFHDLFNDSASNPSAFPLMGSMNDEDNGFLGNDSSTQFSFHGDDGASQGSVIRND